MTRKNLIIYMNGTDDALSGELPWLVQMKDSILKKLPMKVIPLTNILLKITKNEENNVFGYDGCGRNNYDPRDLFSGIFTFHLEKQMKSIAAMVREKVQKQKIRLILFGFSRSAAGVLWLCKNLKDIDDTQLEIYGIALEPVPGNYITTTELCEYTGLNLTFAQEIRDLNGCNNVKELHVILTNESLKDIACHAPVIPEGLDETKLKISVFPGYHKSAVSFLMKENKILPIFDESELSFYYVVTLLKKWGVEFKDEYNISSLLDKKSCYSICEDLNDLLTRENRSAHFNKKISTNPNALYLNTLHMGLNNRTQGKPALAFTIESSAPRNSIPFKLCLFTVCTLPIFIILAMYYFAMLNNDNATEFQENLPSRGLRPGR